MTYTSSSENLDSNMKPTIIWHPTFMQVTYTPSYCDLYLYLWPSIICWPRFPPLS